MYIYLAGGEAWADLLLDMGVRNQLLSFYYLRDGLRRQSAKVLNLLARMRRAKALGYRFMLDSGAFTYKMKGGRGVPPPSGYFREYYDFCMSEGDLFDVILEFDIDDGTVKDESGNPVTTDQTNEWINEFLDSPIALRFMPVYHEPRGLSWLHDWLVDTRSPLVATASSVVTGTAAVIAKAHKFGKFIHGLAQTRMKTDIRYTNFDSVDSTTWLRADKFGGTMIFQNGKLIVLDHLHKGDRRLYRTYYERWGLDFRKIMEDDLDENRRATIVCWRELANAYEAAKLSRQEKPPYLYRWANEGKRLPDEHPLVTAARKKGGSNANFQD